jgi:hypothetical protein
MQARRQGRARDAAAAQRSGNTIGTVTRFALIVALISAVAAAQNPDSLQKALLLYAPFDGRADAVYARGDARIYSAPDYKSLDQAEPGLGRADVEIVAGAGLRRDALRFRSVNRAALFLKASGNTSYSPDGWSGTASFWLRLDPDQDLKGFTDPIQITDKAYNDACIWVDFTKDDRPRHFRLGVFGNLSAWNADNVPPDKNPAFEKRLVVVRETPFSSKRWTHVAVTWSRIGSESGSAKLYVDGQLVGTADGIRERFTWEPEKALIRLGVNYAGLLDDLAIYDRPLTGAEVQQLHSGKAPLAEKR